MQTTFPALLDNIWDKAKGVFDRLVDYEFTKKEFQLVKQARAFQAEQSRADLARRDAFITPRASRSGSAGFDNRTILLLVGGGALLFLLLRK